MSRDLRTLLTSPRLTGRRIGQDRDAANTWPAILTVEQHAALVARFGKPPKPRGEGGPVSPRKYLLTGKALCGMEHDGTRCGSRLWVKKNQGKPRYTCDRRTGGCGRVVCLAAPLEDHVRDAAITAFNDPVMGPKIRAHMTSRLLNPTEERDLLAQRGADRARLDQLADDYADGAFASREQFERANRRVQARLDAVESRLDAIRERGGILVDVPEGTEAMTRAWATWDLEERRAVIDMAVTKVWVKPAGSGRRFTRHRVKIDWRA